MQTRSVMPAKAGIQYAAASRLSLRRLWYTGSSAFAFANDDSSGRDAHQASRTQRVGILDHIPATAGGGARREQHEARRHEGPARKVTTHREIIRDVLA